MNLFQKQNDLNLLKLKNKHQKLITQTNLLNNRENLILQNQLSETAFFIIDLTDLDLFIKTSQNRCAHSFIFS